MTEDKSIPFSLLARIALAIALTIGLLVFLAAARLSRAATHAPILTLRTMDTSAPVSLPAPPPTTEFEEPPPPAPTPELPKLDIDFDSVAPPIQAAPPQEIQLRLEMTDFAPQNQQAREHMTFSSTDLDTQPRLVTKPSVSYPASQEARGITEGKVTLEVLISSSGKVKIRKVVESSHPEFTEMARRFATGSRFTPPKKDGRPVNALFKWPLILRP